MTCHKNRHYTPKKNWKAIFVFQVQSIDYNDFVIFTNGLILAQHKHDTSTPPEGKQRDNTDYSIHPMVDAVTPSDGHLVSISPVYAMVDTFLMMSDTVEEELESATAFDS